MLYLLSISVFAQNRGSDWQYMGKLWVCYDTGKSSPYDPFECKQAFLYAHFDGEDMVYKIYVPEDQESYEAYENPYFSKSKYEAYREASSDDHFRGPHLKTIERYTMKAGQYYFNPTDAHN